MSYHVKLPPEMVTLECASSDAAFDKITDLPRIVKVPGTWSVKGSNTEGTAAQPRETRRTRLLAILTQIENLETRINEKETINNVPSSVQS